MSWSRIRQASLKLRLLVLLLPAMALVTATSLWFTRVDSVNAANAAYDRSLLGAIKALDLNVSTASGGLAVELPYKLFEFFQLTATGNVYFRVATGDGMVEIGHADLPLPTQALHTGQAVFYDAVYFDETVRVGALMRPLEQALEHTSNTQLVIQVAESTTSRQQFTSGFLRQAALRDAALLVVMCVSVVLGLWMALRPLTHLAAQTRARDAQDLRPLQTTHLPSDVQPLVEAVNQQLARTQTLMSQRRGFIDDASHQLRTPLTVLRAQLDFILREPDPHQRDAALQALSAALTQAIRATNQLLTLARSDTAVLRREPFDLTELAHQVAVELLPLARERGIDLGLDADDTALPCAGDPVLLKQALLNLAHNAIEHGRAHGVVTLSARADAQGFNLLVTDDGNGLPPELRGRAGERFAKGRHSRGSGLGLSIARSVAEAHGGRLQLGPTAAGHGLSASLWWPT